MAAKGVKNQAVATAAGVHIKTVSQWLSGKQKPGSVELGRLAAFFEMPEAALRDGKPPEPASTVRELAVREGYRVYTTTPRERLKPRVYERVFGYIARMEVAHCTPEQIEEAERLLIDSAFSKINKTDPRERTEEEQITDIDAAWEWIRRTIVEHEGKTL